MPNTTSDDTGPEDDHGDRVPVRPGRPNHVAPDRQTRQHPTPGPYLRAAEYVRMSTDQQRYSTVAQSEAIHRYAAERGILIVRSYEDAGKSGLNIEGRSALSAVFLG